ncbi:MAG TPA: hypothetical protein VJU87_08935 [Gemmatimonadaceae bacterium]|nr:hypothetical protein [Gemmatimonadaceae bacterium]
MSLRNSVRVRLAVLCGLLVAAATLGACGEKLDEGSSCPLLCPQTSVNLQQVIIDGIVLDSTIGGFPPIGTSATLLLAAHPDTLDTRVIVRFDTLPQTFRSPAATGDSTITHVDSASFRILLDTTTIAELSGPPKRPFTIELYDVDTPASDTVAADLLPLFNSSRLLGSRTFQLDSLIDTLRIPVAPDTVLDRVLAGTHLRIGLRLVSDSAMSLRLQSTAATSLAFWPSKDTSVVVSPVSNTPTDSTQAALRARLAEYVIVATGPPEPPADVLAVGGYPAHRTYLQFDIPPALFDSTTIVRASLLLTQRPDRASARGGDSVTVYPVPIAAGAVLTDVSRLLALAPFPSPLPSDSIRLVPLDSGLKRVELVQLVRVWRAATGIPNQHAIALRIGPESATGAQALFFSTEAGGTLRPRLELTYVPHTTFALP